MYYFLKADLELLDQQIKDLLVLIKETGQEMGSSTQESSETWHDNFGHEDSSRRFKMHSDRYLELCKIRNSARLADSKPSGEKVSLGCIVKVEDEEGNIRDVKIGSYYTLADNKSVSYNSPLARILMSSKVGDEVEGAISGKRKFFTILEIRSYL